MREEIDAVEAVSRAVDRITRYGRFADFELSNGIVLTIKPVPPLLINAVAQEFTPPAVPKIYMEEKGREEENPFDPTYLKEVEEFNAQQELALNDLLLGVGTELKTIPDGYYKPEDDGWVAQVQFVAKIAGKELDLTSGDPIRRYLYWLRFYALETSGDIALAQGLPMQLAGIREGEVDEVIESFRSLPRGGADPELPIEIGSQNGHSENRAARRTRTRN